MKSTGMVRGIDSLGRIVIPKDIRTQFHLTEEKDSVEVFVDDGMIILKKYQPACVFCNALTNNETFKGRLICKQCKTQLLKGFS